MNPIYEINEVPRAYCIVIIMKRRRAPQRTRLFIVTAAYCLGPPSTGFRGTRHPAAARQQLTRPAGTCTRTHKTNLFVFRVSAGNFSEHKRFDVFQYNTITTYTPENTPCPLVSRRRRSTRGLPGLLARHRRFPSLSVKAARLRRITVETKSIGLHASRRFSH